MNADQLGKKAAILGSIEIGLGSLFHVLKIPLGGHLLSLNQGYILTRASIEFQDRRAAGIISTTSALLKSLSPAGQKLTPMLAISAQGQLYGLGTFCFGNNFFGQAVGMTLLGLWGFAQPLAIYVFIFGKAIVSMVDFYLIELNKIFPVTREDLLKVLLGFVLLKILLGIGVVIVASRADPRSDRRYVEWARSKGSFAADQRARSGQSRNAFHGALKDLFQPFFLLSFLLMILFFVFSNSSKSELIWMIMRSLSMAYLIFLGLRVLPVEKLVMKLQSRNPGLADTLNAALKYLRKGRDFSKTDKI